MNDEDDREVFATVASGGTLVFGSKVVGLVFGFLTQLFMARLLTEAQYGDVVLTLAIVNVAALIAILGMDDGLMHQFPRFETDPHKARGVVRAGLGIAVGTGVVAAAVVFSAAPLVARRLFDSTSLTPLLRLGAVGVPFVVVGDVAVSLARGARDAKPHAYVDQLARPLLRFFFVAGLVVAGYGAVGAVAGQVAAIGLAGVLALLLASRALPSFDTSPASMYRPVLAFSVPLMAVEGMLFLNSNIDIYMVGYFLTSSSVGVYNVALQLANLLNAVLLTVGFLLPPALTRLHEQDKHDEMRRLYQRVTKWIVLLGVPVFTVLFFASELVIGMLFGSTYTSGALALRILLGGLLFATVMGLNARSLIGLGRNRVVAYITFGQVLVNGAFDALLVPVYGISGAAGAMTASLVVGNVLGVAILKRDYNIHPFARRVLTSLAAFGVVAVVGYSSVQALALPMPLVVLFIGAAYPFVVKLALSPGDKQLFNRLKRVVS